VGFIIIPPHHSSYPVIGGLHYAFSIDTCIGLQITSPSLPFPFTLLHPSDPQDSCPLVFKSIIMNVIIILGLGSKNEQEHEIFHLTLACLAQCDDSQFHPFSWNCHNLISFMDE
jgi:hypothetical protein